MAKLFISTLLLLLSITSAVFIGPAEISFDSPLWQTLIIDIRLPRVLLALFCGAGLAVCGAVLQNVTGNSLAEPYLFGVVAGAGLGATIVSILLQDQAAFLLPIAAFIGALLAVSLVAIMAVSSRQGGIATLILSGVAVSFMLSSISQFLLFSADPFASVQVMFWLMGSLARAELWQLAWIAPVVLIGTILVLLVHRQLDALVLGDEQAAALGVPVIKLRLLMLTICAAITATLVAYCGGIAFVGLMIPHIVRRLIAASTAYLIIGSAVFGAIFMVWVDVLARSLFGGQEIPVGVITSVIGSLFFLGLMYKK
ncbi:FecCD family ABC transporter permease [Gayadomonas joobiniege]|uniref:FecCD family ABC transporter permease n=1 Tax=Gayadomonas joobiniege TaxID=1234606 RepID=UPI00036166CC|nr:iron ABC transporter permease [Gayadomonas joobiniege]